MTFPSNPNNNDIHTAFGRRLKYKESTSTWEVVSSPSVAIETEAPAATTAVSSSSDLPMSGNQIGAMSYSQDTNTLYVWNGSGWFKIALVNTNPTISGGIESTYAVIPAGDPITITVTASDPEGVPLTWSHTVTSGTVEDTTITNVDNVFTITPGATTTSFNVTFTASDGVNTDTSTTTIAVAVPWAYGGTDKGYVAGGNNSSRSSQIRRFNFANSYTVTNIGNKFNSTFTHAASFNSPTRGYVTMAVRGGGSNSPNSQITEVYTFASESSYALGRQWVHEKTQTATGAHSPDNGYFFGGYIDTAPYYSNTIRRTSFAADTTSSQVGTLFQGTQNSSRNAMITESTAYISGGMSGPTNPPSAAMTMLQKFSYADESQVSNVGTLTQRRTAHACVSSTVAGYSCSSSWDVVSSKEKVTFVSEAISASPGDLTGAFSYSTCGNSSDVGGYATSTTRDYFSFANDASVASINNWTGDQARGASGFNI